MKPVHAMPYLNPAGLTRPIPLERFLPKYPANSIDQYLAAETKSSGWALDPFGSNPLLALEAAASGKNVLVACNNPILVFLFKVLARPVEKEHYLAVLSELASQVRGSERLETHIKNVYQTRCAICHTLIQADGYLWRRNERAPYARVYACPNCGDEGERPVSEEDLAIYQPLQRGEPIHRARALSRVLMGSEEERPAVEEALKVYNPRALYVLFTLLNKFEGMKLDARARMLADALMISLLDAGTALWTWPELADQPRLLTLPGVYFEKNLWREMERCVDLWSQPNQPIEMTLWPILPQQPGICLYPGPIRALDRLPAGMKIDNLLCLPPRPNQAFWTLSALWAAWLWGRDTGAHSFNQVLGRRRFDWHWHTLALQQAFKKAVGLISDSTKVFTQIGEPSPGMVFAVGTASHLAGLQLDGVAQKGAEAAIQTHWRSGGGAMSGVRVNPQSIARQAIRNTLLELGEPTHYLSIYTAVVCTLIVNGAFPATLREFTQEKSSELQGMITSLFNDDVFLRRFEATSQEPESGKWGLANWQGAQIPLADRVEEALVELLRQGNSLPAAQISVVLNSKFPGFLTPPADLVEFCLTSYAEWNAMTSSWQMNEKEALMHRQADIEKARRTIIKLGERLKYDCSGEQFLLWKAGEKVVYRFFLSSTAAVAWFLQKNEDEDIQSVLVIPGSRAALLKLKLIRDPRLREITAHGWHFLKFRALQALNLRGDLTRAVWEMQLDSDPIDLEETTQLRIFG